MKYPCLVPKRLCKTDIHVHLESEELTNLGEPVRVLDKALKCNFQDRAKTILTTEKEAGSDYWYGVISWRYCTGFSIFERRNGTNIRSGTPD